MKKDLSNQSMDAVLQDFLGNKPSMGTLNLESSPADTQEQQEKAAETVSEQADETSQVVRRISGKQRRASLEEYKDSFLSVQYTRRARPHRPHVRGTQDERVGTGGEHRPAASFHLR